MSDGNIFKIDVQCKVDTMDPSLSKVVSPHNCCNAQKVHSWVAMFVWLSRVEGSISTQLLQCTKGTSWVAMFVSLSRVEGSISLRLLQHERTMGQKADLLVCTMLATLYRSRVRGSKGYYTNVVARQPTLLGFH